MIKKFLAMLMAFALVLSLAACGGNNADNSASDSKNDTVQNDSQNTGNTANNNAAGDNTDNDSADNGAQDDAQTPPAEEEEDESAAAPALNREDFTLRNVGDSFKMEVMNMVEGSTVTWSISDETVAVIAEDSTVTAVASGNATITATIDEGGESYALTCIVRVAAEEEADDGGASAIDLNAFYTQVTGSYELPGSLGLLEDDELVENYFTGLTAIECTQKVIYFNMMMVNNGEIAMAEVANGSDVEAVKAIFQSRVDYMVEGGAFYPAAVEIWENNARVVSVGNFVLMVVSDSCDNIVSDFEAFVG